MAQCFEARSGVPACTEWVGHRRFNGTVFDIHVISLIKNLPKGHRSWFTPPICGILLGTGTDLSTAAKACDIQHAATVATLGTEWPPGLLGQWRLLKNLGTQRRGGWLKEDFSCFRERRPKGRSKEEFAQKKVKMFQVQPMRKLWREIAQTSGS